MAYLLEVCTSLLSEGFKKLESVYKNSEQMCMCFRLIIIKKTHMCVLGKIRAFYGYKA